jgi:hypothetical protein
LFYYNLSCMSSGSHFGYYTSGTSPVWGANDRLIGQNRNKAHQTKTLGL